MRLVPGQSVDSSLHANPSLMFEVMEIFDDEIYVMRGWLFRLI